MTGPLNQGLDKTHAEYWRAYQGIRSPKTMMLNSGDTIFRFAGTSKISAGGLLPTTPNSWADGAWWVLEEDYRRIIERFENGRLDLGLTARSALAVQPSWSLMDVSIKAHLLSDVYVFTGIGRTQYRDILPNGMQMTLTGWPDITQIYIPEMKKVRPHIQVQRQKVISSLSLGRR